MAGARGERGRRHIREQLAEALQGSARRFFNTIPAATATIDVTSAVTCTSANADSAATWEIFPRG